MSGASNKQALYHSVENLRKSLRIDNSNYPINTMDICDSQRNIELDFCNFTTQGLCGVAMIGRKKDQIILSANRSERECNFDCGHEAIHLAHHRTIGSERFECFSHPTPSQDTFVEWQANEGSAEFVVPYKLFLPKIKSAYGDLRTWVDLRRLIAELAFAFDVSMPVIKFRLEGLKFEIEQYLSGVPLDSLTFLSDTQQKKKELNILSFNDRFMPPQYGEWKQSAPTPLSTILSQTFQKN